MDVADFSCFLVLLFLRCMLILPTLIGFNLYLSWFCIYLLFFITWMDLWSRIISKYKAMMLRIKWTTQMIVAEWSKGAGKE